MKSKAIIVDIDGTISKNTGRGFHEYHRVSEDAPHDNVVMLVKLLQYNFKILVVSGRPDSCMEATRVWLQEQHIPHNGLFMRKTGDYRKDYIVKKEIYDAEILPKYDILLVFDDRNQVVDMWREIGLTCLQVADGSF